MSERPNQEQMAKLIMPALAISAVIVIVGVLIAYRNSPDMPAPGDGKPQLANSPVTVTPSGNYSAEGLASSLPPVDSPEWRDAGEGMKIWDVKDGEGESCRSGATVTIHYTGWTLDGKSFDSSLPRGEPTTFPLGTLIQGWQKGIPGMKPNGIRRLYIPSKLGYGEGGSGAKIPPNSNLIFEIKLFSAK